ncbi:hypothetical protein [Piscinibacter sp.]|uniref:hypothetical protein n=1 Tax=Piscinibacter sp. TaxID=1903157 RepID=UPI0039E434FC
MNFKNLLIVVLFLVIGWSGWTTLNLAIENDGLRQVAAGHRQSIESLLGYVSVATRCDVTPQELVVAVGATPPGDAEKEVSYLAFQARFNDRGIAEVGVVDVKRVTVCQAK